MRDITETSDISDTKNKMDIYKNSLELINKFFQINLREKNCVERIFNVLKEIIDFNSAYIFYLSPEQMKLEFAYNNTLTKDKYKTLNDIFPTNQNYLSEYLKIDRKPFATILIVREAQFSKDEEFIFKTVSEIIANLIKNIELNEIISLQVQAQQESIVELNNAYKTIKKQNKKIIKSDKIKNDFLSHVSHELRTPLNSIIGFSDLLSTGCCGSLNEKQKDYVNDIKISGLILLGMINEILDISKIESNSMRLNKTNFNISQAISEAVNIVAPLAIKKEIKMTTNIVPIIISADYPKLQQILFNLLSNAIKFTPQNGKINISVCNSNETITISVKDNGVGIAPKYHKKIFNKFEQCHNNQNQNSTGLGLTITKQFVKMHKGSINVVSEEGKGAEFIVTIPC